MTQCTMKSGGPSGSMEKLEALCVLPLNILNEKIYYALWWWFLVLFLISIIGVLFRLIIIIVWPARRYYFC